MILCNSKHARMGATRFQEQSNKTTNESSNDRLDPGNHKMSMIMEKKNVPTIEGKTKIPLLEVICGSIDFFI
jgi:hypothetical protein